MPNVNDYWKKKVEEVVEISKKYGFSEQDTEFWMRQPSGVITLIINMHTTHID